MCNTSEALMEERSQKVLRLMLIGLGLFIVGVVVIIVFIAATSWLLR
jgi:cell division septal protein FtsQ